MASPQIEKGYTPIANELLERIYSFPFTSSQVRIVLYVCRYSYGFKRKSCETPLVDVARKIGICKNTAAQEIRKLIKMNVLTVCKEADYKTTRKVMLNKNYEKWVAIVEKKNIHNTEKTVYPEVYTGISTDIQYTQRYTVYPGMVEEYTQSDSDSIPAGIPTKQCYKTMLQNKEYLCPTDVGRAFDFEQSAFDETYAIYPRHVGKARGLKFYKQYLKGTKEIGGKKYRFSAMQIRNAVQRYADSVQGFDEKYVKMFDTFMCSALPDYVEEKNDMQPKANIPEERPDY